MNARMLSLTAVLALLAPAAHAGLVLTTTPAAAFAGSMGNSFDVILTDTGGTYDVGSFSFEMTVPPTSGVAFTGATMNTGLAAPYIFTGNSVDVNFGLPFPTSVSATDVQADDAVNTPGTYTMLTAGSVFGLGNITYNVAPGTALGPVPVTFNTSNQATTVTDTNGVNFPLTVTNGTIVVAPNIPPSVPEASPFALLGLGLLPVALAARKRRAA